MMWVEEGVAYCAKCGIKLAPYGAWLCSECAAKRKPKENVLPCGHPTACITSDEDLGGEGVTSSCAWCASLANMTITISCPNCGMPLSSVKVDELDGLHSGVTVHCSECGKPISFTELRDGWIGYTGELVTQAIEVARAEERERCARLVEDCKRFYLETIFAPPPLGEHGATVDACSAAAIRGVLPALAADIRELDDKEEPK